MINTDNLDVFSVLEAHNNYPEQIKVELITLGRPTVHYFNFLANEHSKN